MLPQLAVFDMAGTTVYDGDAVNTCFRSALHAAGIQVTRDQANAVMGIAKPLAIRTLLEQTGAGVPVSDTTVQDLYGEFLARMLAYYRTDPAVREVAGARQTFRQLRAAGVRIALDTGFSRVIVEVILDRLGWERDGLLDATVASDEVLHGRPHPDMIFRAMALTGVTDAAQVAKIGDTPSDLQQGHAAACGWVIGVTAGSHTRAELTPYPHTHLVTTIADVPACFA